MSSGGASFPLGGIFAERSRKERVWDMRPQILPEMPQVPRRPSRCALSLPAGAPAEDRTQAGQVSPGGVRAEGRWWGWAGRLRVPPSPGGEARCLCPVAESAQGSPYVLPKTRQVSWDHSFTLGLLVTPDAQFTPVELSPSRGELASAPSLRLKDTR